MSSIISSALAYGNPISAFLQLSRMAIKSRCIKVKMSPKSANSFPVSSFSRFNVPIVTRHG